MAGILREMNISGARATERDHINPGGIPPHAPQSTPQTTSQSTPNSGHNFASQLSPPDPQLSPLLELWAWSDIVRCPPYVYLHDPWACNFIPFTNCSHREKVVFGDSQSQPQQPQSQPPPQPQLQPQQQQQQPQPPPPQPHFNRSNPAVPVLPLVYLDHESHESHPGYLDAFLQVRNDTPYHMTPLTI